MVTMKTRRLTLSIALVVLLVLSASEVFARGHGRTNCGRSRSNCGISIGFSTAGCQTSYRQPSRAVLAVYDYGHCGYGRYQPVYVVPQYRPAYVVPQSHMNFSIGFNWN